MEIYINVALNLAFQTVFDDALQRLNNTFL